MNFIEAAKLAEEGKKIRRSNWDKKLYIKIGDPRSSTTYDLLFWYEKNNADYKINCTDILATDWEIYKEEKIKTYNFQEALEGLNEGYKIKRLSTEIIFIKDQHNKIHKIIPYYAVLKRDFDYSIFTYEDVIGTDWIIINEK